MAQRKLGQILVDLGYINDDQLWDILEEQKQSPGQPIGQVAVRMGLVNQRQVTEALASQWGMPVINLEETNIPPQVLEIVPQPMAEMYRIMPVSIKNNVLTVAMADPQNVGVLDDLRNFLGHEIRGAVSSQADVEAAITRYYADREESIEDVIEQLSTDEDSEKRIRGYDLASDEEMSDSQPIKKLLNMVMLLAIRDQASDIHFEPFEDEFKIRVKADGVLYEMVPPPRHLANAIVSRIKVMSNLDIAER
ncbi:MAG: GspE/PulE family protein, partial [Planctomyces sp.]